MAYFENFSVEALAPEIFSRIYICIYVCLCVHMYVCMIRGYADIFTAQGDRDQ